MVGLPAQNGVETPPCFLQAQALIHNAPAQRVQTRHFPEIRRSGLDGPHRRAAFPPVRRGDREHQVFGKDRQIHRKAEGPGNARGVTVHARGLRAQAQQGGAEGPQKIIDLSRAGGLVRCGPSAGTAMGRMGKRGLGRALLERFGHGGSVTRGFRHPGTPSAESACARANGTRTGAPVGMPGWKAPSGPREWPPPAKR